MNENQQTKFAGELGRALKIDMRADGSAIIKQIADASVEMVRRRGLLFDRYGIDRLAPDANERLSLALAEEFVPGMRIELVSKSPRGRKATWDAKTRTIFWLDIERIKRLEGVKDSDAIQSYIAKKLVADRKSAAPDERIKIVAADHSALTTRLWEARQPAKNPVAAYLDKMPPEERETYFEFLLSKYPPTYS